jgi:hypothetical protein
MPISALYKDIAGSREQLKSNAGIGLRAAVLSAEAASVPNVFNEVSGRLRLPTFL